MPVKALNLLCEMSSNIFSGMAATSGQSNAGKQAVTRLTLAAGWAEEDVGVEAILDSSRSSNKSAAWKVKHSCAGDLQRVGDTRGADKKLGKLTPSALSC